MPMHTELWFPSVIWSAMTHFGNNSQLKSFAYQRQKDDKGRVISNDGGYQSTDIQAGINDDIDNLVKNITLEVNSCAIQVGMSELELYNIWVNINPPGSCNQLHHHQGAVLSGVYYVDATPEQGNIFFERTDGAEYHIPLEVQQQTYYTSTRTSYASKTGALYIFPGWLKHGVQVNKTNKDRISISFNYSEKK